MATEFLARILTIENIVTSEGGQDCIVCQEKCGTLSPETGIMELEVQLPCGHTAGSACIANWLADNNTCPLCRQEFFPRQPCPHMEREIMQGTGDDESNLQLRHQGESDDDYLHRLFGDSESDDDPLFLAIQYCRQLNLSFLVVLLAASIADTAKHLPTLDRYSVESVAAASTYIASHIISQPRSLTDITCRAAVSERTIHSVYRDIYSERYRFIRECWREMYDGVTVDEIADALPDLPWPPLEHGIIDSEGEGDSGPAVLGGRLVLVKELCSKFDGDNEPDNMISFMAHKVAEKMDSMTLDWKTVNPEIIAAACTYTASHLVFQGKTFEQINAVSGVNPASIRRTYEVLYGVRELFIQEEWFETFLWTRENALYCMPKP